MTENMTVRTSTRSFTEAVSTLEAGLARRGIPVFATIDHAGGARKAGLEMPDETVIIFGNPAVGTALMQEDPRVGVALPLRILIWTGNGETHVGYQDPRALADSFSLANSTETLGKLSSLLEQLVSEIVAT